MEDTVEIPLETVVEIATEAETVEERAREREIPFEEAMVKLMDLVMTEPLCDAVGAIETTNIIPQLNEKGDRIIFLSQPMRATETPHNFIDSSAENLLPVQASTVSVAYETYLILTKDGIRALGFPTDFDLTVNSTSNNTAVVQKADQHFRSMLGSSIDIAGAPRRLFTHWSDFMVNERALLRKTGRSIPFPNDDIFVSFGKPSEGRSIDESANITATPSNMISKKNGPAFPTHEIFIVHPSAFTSHLKASVNSWSGRRNEEASAKATGVTGIQKALIEAQSIKVP